MKLKRIYSVVAMLGSWDDGLAIRCLRYENGIRC